MSRTSASASGAVTIASWPLAQVCRRLDGIAMAIELAAARVRVLSVAQIAARLDDRFRLLAGGSRTALRRQQTLRALVDWSFDLLSSQEQLFFRRLAVFAGGWQLEAAERVCADGGPNDEALDLLTALVDKSLVVVDTGPGDPPRYRPPETLREYALERLASRGEAETVRGAHARYYTALAEQLADAPFNTVAVGGGRLVAELDNFRAALRWSADAGAWNDGFRLIGVLGPYWHHGCHFDEGARWLELALRRQSDVTPAIRSQLLVQQGGLAFLRGDYAAALSFTRESVRVCRDSGDRRAAARALEQMGTILRDLEEHDEASAALEEALHLSQEEEERSLVSGPLFQLGLLARQRGELDRAEALLTESLRVVRQSGSDPGGESAVCMNLGQVADDRGDLERAHRLFAESLSLVQASGWRW